MNMKSRVIPVGSEGIIIVISHPQKPETTIKLLFWVGVLIAVMPLLVLYDVVMFMGLFSTEFTPARLDVIIFRECQRILRPRLVQNPSN